MVEGLIEQVGEVEGYIDFCLINRSNGCVGNTGGSYRLS